MVPCSHRDESQVLGIIQTMSFVLTAEAGPHILPATGVRHLQSNVLGIRPLLGLLLQLHKTRNRRETHYASSWEHLPCLFLTTKTTVVSCCRNMPMHHNLVISVPVTGASCLSFPKILVFAKSDPVVGPPSGWRQGTCVWEGVLGI